MPISRVFQAIQSILPGDEIRLDAKASHHVARVLRANLQDALIIFNGLGGEYHSVIQRIDKKSVTVKIENYNPREAESSLQIYLAQGISRGEKMDYTIQKAVELGVKKIIPLFTERATVKLDAEKREKRQQHWQSIVVGACEQSGRNHIPEVLLPQLFNDWIKTASADICFVLSPEAQTKLMTQCIQPTARIIILIGPEGGLSEREIQSACQAGFSLLNLGPRVLRTETAAVAAIASIQSCFGDM